MMIISTAASPFVILSNVHIDKDFPPKVYYYIILQGVSALLRDGMFNISHWMFAYEYYNSAVALPLIFNHKEVPQTREKWLTRMNVTLLILNGLAPLCALIIHEYANWLYSCCGIDILASKSRLTMYSTFRYSVGFFQLVSGILLLVAVAKIRSFLVESGLTHACNYKSMTLHAVSFSLYSFAIFAYYAALFLLNLAYNDPNMTQE